MSLGFDVLTICFNENAMYGIIFNFLKIENYRFCSVK